MGNFVANLPKGITKDSPSEVFQEAYWQSGYKMPLEWVINKF